MYRVELYARVRRACHVEGMSIRDAARVFGVDRRTVAKMLSHSVPPGYRRSRPGSRPKLDPFIGIIERILKADRQVHRRQRHTAKPIFERLRDEHNFVGGYTIVKDYVREHWQRSREVFVPLAHDPGHAEVDFGEARALIGGQDCKIHVFAMELPHPVLLASRHDDTNRLELVDRGIGRVPATAERIEQRLALDLVPQPCGQRRIAFAQLPVRAHRGHSGFDPTSIAHVRGKTRNASTGLAGCDSGRPKPMSGTRHGRNDIWDNRVGNRDLW